MDASGLLAFAVPAASVLTAKAVDYFRSERIAEEEEYIEVSDDKFDHDDVS